MASICNVLCCREPEYSSGEEIEDDDATNLTHVGTAAYDELRKHHNEHHHQLWNVTSGKMVGQLHQTPLDGWPRETDPEDGHDDWFPKKMGEIMSRTKKWCDVLSLGPPDGLFLDSFKEALQTIVETASQSDKPVIIRVMFGNIVGMPVNCNKVIKELTKDLKKDANIRLWVGAWRKGVSWNHAKIIAVDGRYLHTGGHNLWDPHYLKFNPVHDLSLEMEGRVTHDGHLFANEQWAFVEKKQSSMLGSVVDKLPDYLPMAIPTRVTVSEFPTGKAEEFPPEYKKRFVPKYMKLQGEVPIITMGRYGALLRKDRPSDDAFLAMLGSAKTIIRMALQDLGPVCLPGTKVALPGCIWPDEYLSCLARVMWERGVDVEIALSNPGSIPGGLSPTEACYGNGWSCVDVAAEIIKRIKKQFPDAEDDDLRKKVTENLRVCFIREKQGKAWKDGTTMGMHAKHFIIDDVCTYIGSQNLYVCDLAEWGVVIDSADQSKKFMDEYWHPMWKYSYTDEDCDVQEVMDGLDIDRDGEDPKKASEETKKLMAQAEKANMGVASGDEYYDKNVDETKEQ